MTTKSRLSIGGVLAAFAILAAIWLLANSTYDPPAQLPAKTAEELRAAQAQWMAARYVAVNELPEIIAASQQNEAKFDRDFKDRMLRATGKFAGSIKGIWSDDYSVKVDVNGGKVDCSVSPDQRGRIADWPVGITVVIEGEIRSTILGTLILSQGCTVTAG